MRDPWFNTVMGCPHPSQVGAYGEEIIEDPVGGLGCTGVPLSISARDAIVVSDIRGYH
ncbi:MAG: hypothetical protein J6K69_08450 [Candidatus Methanomethylophilaceae archaeon]|nr:hypothetical protein [Candidatus Methanomethylophilaceae archaeon]MBR2347513.1 hypothetical protein [Candidatus Methanomethylophilaceae archaeon]MBR2394678.1 hypothetical protein [Candidatus Methanomethylophilaceae archaeon]